MGYNNLSECTLNDQERRDEVTRIIHMVLDARVINLMTAKDRGFVMDMQGTRSVSVAQLFYARDIKAKYIE